MPTASPKRLAVVVSHPTQYYSPWFRDLSQSPGVELKVFYLWDFGVRETKDPRFQQTFKWDVDLLSGYQSEFIPNVAKLPGAEGFFGFHNPQAIARLKAWKADAILLFGYNWFTHVRIILWARLSGVPLIFRGDSHFIGRAVQANLRIAVLRLLYRQFAAVTYVGSANREYFRTLGVPERKLFFAPHSVNTALFNPGDSAHREGATALRAQLHLSATTTVVLFAGKFVADKQPLELLDAFLAVRTDDAVLVFVGDGPQKDALQSRAHSAPPRSVFFLPFANQSEMPARLLAASLFALPSRGLYETWGLAVNEAMHLGIPCLVSDRVGCQRDLVIDGETGWVFRATDPQDLRARLAEALATAKDPVALARIRKKGAERISHFTYAETTNGALAALAYASPAQSQ